MTQFHESDIERRALAERMKDPDDELKLVIVRDMFRNKIPDRLPHGLARGLCQEESAQNRGRVMEVMGVVVHARRQHHGMHRQTFLDSR